MCLTAEGMGMWCPHIDLKNEGIGKKCESWPLKQAPWSQADRRAYDDRLAELGKNVEQHREAAFVLCFWTCKGRDGSTDLLAADESDLKAKFDKSSAPAW